MLCQPTCAGRRPCRVVVGLRGDPALNPVGNDIRMWLYWRAAGLFVAVGAGLISVGIISKQKS